MKRVGLWIAIRARKERAKIGLPERLDYYSPGLLQISVWQVVAKSARRWCCLYRKKTASDWNDVCRRIAIHVSGNVTTTMRALELNVCGVFARYANKPIVFSDRYLPGNFEFAKARFARDCWAEWARSESRERLKSIMEIRRERRWKITEKAMRIDYERRQINKLVRQLTGALKNGKEHNKQDSRNAGSRA